MSIEDSIYDEQRDEVFRKIRERQAEKRQIIFEWVWGALLDGKSVVEVWGPPNSNNGGKSIWPACSKFMKHLNKLDYIANHLAKRAVEFGIDLLVDGVSVVPG